jgi:cysteine desulfurase/selenocysteine lyase
MSKNIKSIFPALKNRINGKKLIYFDNACSVLKPKPVIEAILNYYNNLGACAGGRSTHFLSRKVEDICDESREKVRKFIGAEDQKEIIFTKNTTEGINIVAKSFPFSKRKNEIIILISEHHSNILPFFEEEKREKVKLTIFNVESDGSIDLNKLEKAISSKTALVSLAHISNVLGNINPIKEIIGIAHKKNSVVLIDDAQYVGIHKENVRKNDIDFLVFSGHKIGGPTGTGVLYGKKELLKKMASYNVGGGTVASVFMSGEKLRVNYLSSPRIFEAGVQNYAGIAGLGAAVDFIESIGQKNIFEQVSVLRKRLMSGLSSIGGIEVIGDPQSSLVSFFFKSKNHFAHDLNIFLDSGFDNYTIATRCGHHCAMPVHQYLKSPHSLRASFFVYNTVKEVDIFLRALKCFLDK